MGRDPDRAVKIACEVLNDSPDDVDAMMLIAYLFGKAGRHGLSLALLARASQVAPHRHEIWAGMGVSWQRMGNELRSRQMFQEGAKRKPGAYTNEIATTYIEEGDWKRAEQLCRKVLAQHPDDHGAWTTLGYARLAQGDWREGWKGYAHSLMSEWRKEIILGDEPRWDGRKGVNLFVYGEQGLGDEIMYASCVPDAARDAASVVLECDPRLEGLFRRSFPNVSVYGTRLKQGVDWLNRHQIDARVGVAGLPEYYRPEPAACPGTPYLVADPERRMQWRSLFRATGKPVIGLAWNGGKRWTKAGLRSFPLTAFEPLMRAVDAHFVCLEYKDAAYEIADSGLPVRQYPWATLTSDYDDTAAMVAELDCVVCSVTTVMHLAGALGVPTTVLRPPKRGWSFEGASNPWHSSVTYFDQRAGEKWKSTIERLATSFHRVRPETAARLQRVATLDCEQCVGAGVDYPADSEATAH
jgi:hypothetical protein